MNNRRVPPITVVVRAVVAATDGSAIDNPRGPAGWAWYVSGQCWAAGGFPRASNQVAEMFAVLALLRAVPRPHPLLIRTDSQFVVNSLSRWLPDWKRNGWRKRDGQPPANLALLRELDVALTGRSVRFTWVRGHCGDPMNEHADRLCTAASAAIRRGGPVNRGPGWSVPPAPPAPPDRPVTRRPRPHSFPTPVDTCPACETVIDPETARCRCNDR